MPNASSQDSSDISAPQADGTPQPTPGEVSSAELAAEPGATGSEPVAPAHRGATGTGRWPLAPEVSHVRSEIESQIRAKPGRALLIALGVGYVVGRVFRRRRDD